MHRFPTPTPPRLTIVFRAGNILVETAEVTETTVSLRDRDGDESSAAVAATVIEQRGNDIIVAVPKRWPGGRSPELDLQVTAPRLTALRIETGSAGVIARGEFGTTDVTSGSGDVDIDDALDSARLRAGSGDVRIRSVTKDLDVQTGSGRIDVGTVGGAMSANSGSGDIALATGGTQLRAKTGSGDVSVGTAPVEVHAITASGDVRVATIERGEITIRGASGDIRAGVRSGTAAWLDVRTISGRVRSELDVIDAPAGDEETVRLHVETASGDIELLRV